MIALLSFGVIVSIALFAVFLIEARRTKKVSLEERLNRGVGRAVKKESQLGYLDKLEQELERGKTGITVPVYFLIAVVAGTLLFILGMYLLESLEISFVLAALGCLAPRQIVSYMAKSKRQQFDLLFAKVLKHMAASLRTGSTLPQAVQSVVEANSIPKTVREEMKQVLMDYEYGDTMEEAFLSLYQRTGSIDAKSIAMAIEISNQRGTKLYEVCSNYIKAITGRKEIEAEARAKMAETRVEINVVGVVPFIFLIYFKTFAPEFINITYEYANGLGKYVIFALLVFVGIGNIVCRKKCNIKLSGEKDE